MATRSIPQSSSSGAVKELIQKFFVQLTVGCGDRNCNNPDCATGRGKPFDPDDAASRAVVLVQNRNGRLCRPLSSPNNRTLPQSSSYSSISSDHSIVSQEVGVDGGRSEVTLLHLQSTSRPSTSEPMELTLIPSDVHEHSTRELVIGSSSASMVRSFSQNHGSPSASIASHTTTSTSTASSSSSSSTSTGLMMGSSSSSSSSSAIIHMASSNMVDDVARMEVSPTPHHPHRPSSYSPSPYPTQSRNSTKQSNAQSLPVHIISPSTNEAEVNEMIKRARSVEPNDWKEITSMIWLVFSDPEALNKSFLLPVGSEGVPVTKTGDEKNGRITVDIAELRRTYNVLHSLEIPAIVNAFENAMSMYCSTLARHKKFCQIEPLNHIVVLLENPQLHSPEFMMASGKLLALVTSLHILQKEMLVRFYSTYSSEHLRVIVSNFHQLITMQLLFSDDLHKPPGKMYLPQTDPLITSSTSVMMIFYFANLLLSEKSGVTRPMNDKISSIAANPKPRFLDSVDLECDQLLMRFQVHPVNVLKPVLKWEEFRNEELNNRINMVFDYQMFGDSLSREKHFSFLEYPFILNTANKVEKLLLDNRASHNSERQRTFVHTLLTGVRDTPFLHLHINREDIVSDTLSQLEAISEMNPVDLRKQLRVEFKGEEGLDEGGLQKELFQLLIEQLLDPMYGLFTYNEKTRLHWFNPASFETEHQFRLIGLLFGLAIYNNIILDVHFPMVVYIKLLGCQTVFQDLYSSHPRIAQSLQSMLEYEGDDFQETFMATFQVSFSDMFDNLQTFDLREGGDKIPVTLENRQEYVDEYCQWLLNDSISSHFNAFKDGFDLVMSNNFLADLFQPEELEMMVCGSNEWDIDALEESTRYDGFSSIDRVVVHFWQIVREYGENQKKQLLQFITGSDRIPLGGLAKLKFIIVKNGPDSDRLPTAHTCFNALLLCEYSSKEKLKERLTKAISYAKGFGML